MCSECRERLARYYGSDAVWQTAQALYEANPAIGGAAHCEFEDENLELHHLYSTRAQIAHELWLRDMKERGFPTANVFDGLTNEVLEQTVHALQECIDLGEALFGIPSADI